MLLILYNHSFDIYYTVWDNSGERNERRNWMMMPEKRRFVGIIHKKGIDKIVSLLTIYSKLQQYILHTKSRSFKQQTIYTVSILS